MSDFINRLQKRIDEIEAIIALIQKRNVERDAAIVMLTTLRKIEGLPHCLLPVWIRQDVRYAIERGEAVGFDGLPDQ